jgi:hypothetical protein
MPGSHPASRGARRADRAILNIQPQEASHHTGSGRKNIFIAGLWTEVCAAWPALNMLKEGCNVYIVSRMPARWSTRPRGPQGTLTG